MLQTLERPYKVFEGDSYRALMPQLREAGLLPMSMADVMRARLVV